MRNCFHKLFQEIEALGRKAVSMIETDADFMETPFIRFYKNNTYERRLVCLKTHLHVDAEVSKALFPHS